MQLYKLGVISFYWVVLALTSCEKGSSNTSDLNIEGGIIDYQTSLGVIGLYNVIPGHKREPCTGTIVRHDLVLTAAHCFIEGTENRVYPYQNLEQEGGFDGIVARGLKSSLFVIHPDKINVLPKNLMTRLGSDIAFVIFEKNTFVNWPKPLKIAKNEPKAGDLVKLVGYGQGGWNENQTGIAPRARRSGENLIERILPDLSNAIRIYCSWNCKKSMPSFGDSGGPLINEKGEILGVLTGGTMDSNYYVNVNDKEIKKFINIVMRDPNPNPMTGQNLKNVSFEGEGTERLKKEIVKNPQKPGVPDEL